MNSRDYPLKPERGACLQEERADVAFNPLF